MAEYKYERGLLWSRKGVTLVFLNATLHPWEPVLWWLPNYFVLVFYFIPRRLIIKLLGL